ncbi:MAG: amylo-alpha-1,6-glucosidase [Tannerella sp.]|jgi:predicted glycogen debranching enzyme|nr:amylo-alpha-1,6-glucosidase [Tannerella sp.]
MSYLKFDKTLMINLQESLSREILRANQKGAYHSTTIVDCNTRKYHGLLVMPVPGMGDDNHVILSSLDETVIQHGAAFNLGLHKYQGGSFSPNGHKYIREYSMEIVPRTLYRVGGVILSKEKIFSRTDNLLMIRYKLLDAHSVTTLCFHPFLAFRSVQRLCRANDSINRHYDEVQNGIKTCLYPGYPDLYMQFTKQARFKFDPNWYNGIEYPKEQERGYPYQEDLYVPGYFELEIKKGESIIFCAGDREFETGYLHELFEKEVNTRSPRSSFYKNIVNSVHQFYYNPKGNDYYLLAGYPWFGVRARDLFISVCAATLVPGEYERYENVMRTAVAALYRFVKDGEPDPVIHEIDSPDVLLWAIWSMQQYRLKEGLEKAREKYSDIVEEIMKYILSQSHPNLKLSDNGLLYTSGRNRAVTWMNSTVNGRPVVPRSGYIVEFNALWYNALKFYKELNNRIPMDRIDNLIASLDVSFPATFVNKYNYLYDYVDGPVQDWSVRPNMVIAISCEYSPLTKLQKRAVLDIATKELLTLKGLRSLSPKSGGYRPNYIGSQYERDMAYHQGTVWPWLLGMYISAYLKLFGRSGLSFVERSMISMEEEISHHCIGTVSELYDGNPPFTGRGAISFLMNLAAVLDVLDMLKKYDIEYKQV